MRLGRLKPELHALLPAAFCSVDNGRLREPVLPAGCKPVADTAKCPGRFNSEPGLLGRRIRRALAGALRCELLFWGRSLSEGAMRSESPVQHRERDRSRLCNRKGERVYADTIFAAEILVGLAEAALLIEELSSTDTPLNRFKRARVSTQKRLPGMRSAFPRRGCSKPTSIG
jgi:hypothetical protein